MSHFRYKDQRETLINTKLKIRKLFRIQRVKI